MNTPFLLFFRRIPTLTTLLTVILFVAVGCGSDDDGDAVSLPGTVPVQLNYEISQATGNSMTLSQNPSATVTSASLTGSFNRNTEDFTLNAQTLPAMVVSAAGFLNSLDPSFNDYQLRVISAATWTGDGDPTSGEFDIVSADGLHTINVKVNNTLPGVDIAYLPSGGVAVNLPLDWQEFDDAFDNPVVNQEFAAVASFATSLLRFVYEQGELVVQTLEFIGENSDVIELNPPIVEACDIFPLPADDQTVINPGTSMVSWSDVDNSIDINSGDRFFLDFVDCWDDDPTDPIDTLYDRGISFFNYTEVQTAGVITRVGFESPGGIDFTGLEITETEDDGINILIFGNEAITLTGGFSMVFTAP